MNLDNGKEYSSLKRHIKKYLKKNGIRMDTGLGYVGNRLELYINLMKIITVEWVNVRGNMEVYKRNNDIKNYAVLAHAIKSNAALLGDLNLSEKAARMELECKNHNLVYWDSEDALIRSQILQTENVLKGLLDEIGEMTDEKGIQI